MKARLFPPRRARKAKNRVERAKLLIAAARDRAIAQQRAEPSMKRPPTVSHKRRLAEMLSARS